MDLEEIRKRKMSELRARMDAEEEERAQEAQQEQAVDAVLRRILTADARARLKNIELANPRLAQQVISLLIQLYQAGQVSVVTEQQLVALLKKLSQRKREMEIKIKRK